MAIKMKYSEITNGALLQTLNRIASAPINPAETFKIRKIAKMMKAVSKHSVEISTFFQNDLLPHYAEKREDGDFIDRETQQGKPFQIIKEKEKEYKAALAEFNDRQVTFADGIEKLNWKDIAHAGVRPVEVLHLEGIFNEESMDEIPEEGDIAEAGPGLPTRAATGAPLKSV